MAMAEVPVPEQKTARVSDSPMAIDSLEATPRSSTAVPDTTNEEQHDKDSSRQRSTIASCKACKADFAKFSNGWIRITGSYYLPARQDSYRITALHAKGKPKHAAEQSALNGCTIQQLVCNCDDTLAIICIKAPDSKRAYAERDFFKLPKIQLRSETDGKPVDPIIEGDHQAVSPPHQAVEATTTATNAATMDRSGDVTVATVQKPVLPSMSVLGHKSQDDMRRNDLPSVRTIPSQQLQPKPPMSERDVQMAPQGRIPDHASAPATSNGHAQLNGSTVDVAYPSSLAVKLDAIDRLQTQVNLNRATLESCTRDITRLESSFRQLHAEFKETVDTVRMELIASRQHAATAAPATTPQAERLDDQALEVFSSTLSQVVNKTNEVDALKVQFEMIKRRLKRLEEGNTSPTVAVPYYPRDQRQQNLPDTMYPRDQRPLSRPDPLYPRDQRQVSTPDPLYPRDQRQQTVQDSVYPRDQRQQPKPDPVYPRDQREQPMQNTTVAQHGPRVQEPRMLPSQPAQHVAYTPEPAHAAQRQDNAQTAAPNWVSVNTGMKRGAPGGSESGAENTGTPIGSPKRAKLAPLEPRYAYEPQTGSGPVRYERMDTEETVGTQGHRTASHDSHTDVATPSNFVSYTQDGGADEGWRPVSQRAVSGPAATGGSPRGRGRGRGRGGRPRKSMPLEPHIVATPEWEKEAWAASQVDADGFHRGTVTRRGSGGGPAIGLSPTQAFDPYGHTKRSRTKPIRNADGVLIRKDGRPDMRSQSSAANLRKVHAKKEEERRDATGPTSSLAGDPMTVAESPTSTVSHDVDMGSTQERSDHIMKQMFPKGAEQERARLYAAQQYFSSDQSPAGTAAGTPARRSVSESESAGSVEPEKSRDDTPQQRDETMEDQPAEDETSSKLAAAPSASTDSHTPKADAQSEPAQPSTKKQNASADPL